MNLLIATHNQAKLKELQLGLRPLEKQGIKFVSLNDLKITSQPEETGKTFCENSLIKAKYYGDLTSLPTIADDGGLIIPYLNNEPGIKSRRWPGVEASDEKLINFTLGHLRGVLGVKRTAYLQTCITFFNPNTKQIFQQTEKIKGHIAEKPSGKATNGYPFRALFIVDKFNKYYDELSKKEHEIINHRLKAIGKLINML